MPEEKKYGAAALADKFKKMASQDPRAAKLLHRNNKSDRTISQQHSVLAQKQANNNESPKNFSVPDPESFGEGNFFRAFNEFLGCYIDYEEECRHNSQIARLPNAPELAAITASATLCIANGFSRQSVTNLKLISDLNKCSFYEVVKKYPRDVFTNGMMPRMTYQAVGIFPALRIREELTKSGAPSLVVSFGTSIAETVCRFPFEAVAIKKIIEKTQNIKVTPMQMAHVMHRSFYPFFLRNSFAWGVINNSSGEIGNKIICGTFAGATSTLFETFGNCVIKHSVTSNSMQECCQKALSDLKIGERTEIQNIAKNLFRGFQLRGSAGALSAILLSPESEKMVTKNIEPIFKDLQEFFMKKGFAIKGAESFVAKEVPKSETEIQKGSSSILNEEEFVSNLRK